MIPASEDFTAAEDEIIIALLASRMTVSQIAGKLGRQHKQVRSRIVQIELSQPTIKRRRRAYWTEYEDGLLVKTVREKRKGFDEAALLLGRTEAACFNRYYSLKANNFKSPRLEDRAPSWSHDEDTRLLAKPKGKSYKELARDDFPGRTPNALKARFQILTTGARMAALAAQGDDDTIAEAVSVPSTPSDGDRQHVRALRGFIAWRAAKAGIPFRHAQIILMGGAA